MGNKFCFLFFLSFPLIKLAKKLKEASALDQLAKKLKEEERYCASAINKKVSIN
jgi:hypothetical protein